MRAWVGREHVTRRRRERAAVAENDLVLALRVVVAVVRGERVRVRLAHAVARRREGGPEEPNRLMQVPRTPVTCPLSYARDNSRLRMRSMVVAL